MGRLPDKGSNDGNAIIKRYLAGERQTLVDKLEFPNVGSFTRAMREVYGVHVTQGNMSSDLKNTRPAVNIPLKIKTGDEPETVAVICDTHNPFQDVRALELAENLLVDIQPSYLIYNGDANDFYQVSVFDKDPSRLDSLQADIDNTRAMFRHHGVILPNTKKILIEGNHEYRWQRFLWSSASQLASLECLTIPELFHLDEYEIDYVPYEQGLMINDSFLVLHGDIASIHSGYTAKRLYEKHGGCGVCGHCHRGGAYYKRDRFGTWGWWEGFCLCQLNPDWIKNPNWVQGLTLVHFMRKRFWVEQIPIIDGSLMYGGKLYK